MIGGLLSPEIVDSCRVYGAVALLQATILILSTRTLSALITTMSKEFEEIQLVSSDNKASTEYLLLVRASFQLHDGVLDRKVPHIVHGSVFLQVTLQIGYGV